MVDELAAAGLARRQPDPATAGSSYAALTPQGKAALRARLAGLPAGYRRHLGARLTAQQCERLELAALLGQVIATSGS